VTVVAAMRVVGVLLVAALMVLPVATSRLVARSFRSTILWSVGVSTVSVIGGLVAARQWDLARRTIVLSTVTLFALTSLLGGRRRRTHLTDAEAVDH